MPALPTPASVGRLLLRPLPYSSRPLPLRDRTQDAGLFGPDSVTWRVMREPLLILGGGRALLLQAAHPLVAQGAIDHSAYATDPFGRLMRTVLWVTMTTFGTTAEARAASRTVVGLHRKVRGALPAAHATRGVRGGTVYTADDAALLRWVHASFVDTMLVTHDALIGGLHEADRDRFVREWDAVARLMRVPADLLWSDHAALRRYVTAEVERGDAVPGPGSRQVARTVLHPPLSSTALRPGWELVAFTTTGLLPPPLRRGYGLLWTPAHAAAHAALCTWLRSAKHTFPRRVRVSPVYDLAMARTEGRWPELAATG